MFSITNFKAKTKFVRSNQFFVEIHGVSPNINDTLSMRCESVEFPGRTISTVDDVSYGPSTKHAYEVAYGEITLGIIASEDMTERKYFEDWMDKIVIPSGTSIRGGGHVKYYNEYATGTVSIYQINDQNQQIAKCVCYGAYPIGVGPIALSYEDENTYQRFAITITYRYHEIDYTKVRLNR